MLKNNKVTSNLCKQKWLLFSSKLMAKNVKKLQKMRNYVKSA